MPEQEYEFSRIVSYDLVSDDPDIRRLAIKRLYVLMTGEPGLDDAQAEAKVKEMGALIAAASLTKEAP